MEYPKYGMRYNGGFKSNKERLGRREAKTRDREPYLL
jgi:hypothetical protein